MPAIEWLLICFSAAFYISWGIGANDETMAVAATAKFISIKQIVTLGAVFACLGAVLFGHIVEKTIGTSFLVIPVAQEQILIIVLSTALWLTIASWWGWPVSTTHTAVGAVLGFGFMIGGAQTINWAGVSIVILGWVLSPLIGVLTAFMACRVATLFLRNKNSEEKEAENKKLLYLLIFSACLTELWRGANDVGNATAFISLTFENPLVPRVLGGVGIATGLFILGRRVVRRVGTEITRLPISAALSAQLSTALIVFVGTIFGFPLSGTHVLVSAIVGAGLAVKSKIDFKTLTYVIFAWFFTFPVAALIAVVVTYGFFLVG